MPTTSEHRLRAEHNLRFAQSFNLATTPYIDWVVVGYFYAALHLIDALLSEKENLHPDIHEIRTDFVKNKWYLRAIRNEYRELKDRSEDARYRLLTFTKRKVEEDVIPLYIAIENHVLLQLAK